MTCPSGHLDFVEVIERGDGEFPRGMEQVLELDVSQSTSVGDVRDQLPTRTEYWKCSPSHASAWSRV
jgi:hypothetical protein